jgi:hypothetical protein
MLKYMSMYESVSEAHLKTFKQFWGINHCLLQMLLVFVKLALYLSHDK